MSVHTAAIKELLSIPEPRRALHKRVSNETTMLSFDRCLIDLFNLHLFDSEQILIIFGLVIAAFGIRLGESVPFRRKGNVLPLVPGFVSNLLSRKLGNLLPCELTSQRVVGRFTQDGLFDAQEHLFELCFIRQRALLVGAVQLFV